MDSVLIDSDVILDFYLDRKPFAENASEILHLCEIESIKGFVTPVMISNIYYLLKKTASHQKVIENLIKLMKFIDVVIIDKTEVLNALNSHFKDFEDALQSFSAEHQGDISVIITRNVKDYKTSNLAVMTPDEFLKLF